MIEVVVNHLGASEIMQIVQDLRSQGLQQGKDFDFSFHQAKWDGFSHEAVTPRHTVFQFHTEKYATLFTLRYGS